MNTDIVETANLIWKFEIPKNKNYAITCTSSLTIKSNLEKTIFSLDWSLIGFIILLLWFWSEFLQKKIHIRNQPNEFEKNEFGIYTPCFLSSPPPSSLFFVLWILICLSAFSLFVLLHIDELIYFLSLWLLK